MANYPKPSLLGFCSEFSQIQRSKPDLLFSEFSGFYILFNLQLSRFVAANFFKSNSDIISRFFLFVNNFFDIFSIFLNKSIYKYYMNRILRNIFSKNTCEPITNMLSLFSVLIESLIKPACRNGRRGRLKICCG